MAPTQAGRVRPARRGGRAGWQAATALVVSALVASAVGPAAPAGAAVPTISTVAGGGLGEGPATSFPQEPVSLALQGSTLYVSDTTGLVVRALDLATGRQRVVAGDGASGFGGDGGPARSARLFPGGLAVDAAANLYIADTVNHRVRRVDASGTIRTVAGTGVGGFGGDGGPATSARLSSPAGVAFDGAGNLYIADAGNWRIRKVTPQGIITTIAGNGQRGETGDGGPALAAAMVPPFVLAVDGPGNVYVGGLSRVRKVSTAGVITTVAGNGRAGTGGDGGPATAAAMSGPTGLALDAAGNLYVSDYYNVRRIDGTGTITSYAGQRTPFGDPFSGDGGPAVDARLNGPSGLALHPTGGLYVSDTRNGRVREVASGTIRTVAGNGSLAWGGDGGPAVEAQLANPRSVATDRSGNAYVLDGYVRKVGADGRISAFAGDPVNPGNQFGGDGGPATAALLAGPTDVATDRAGNVYVAEQFSHRVRRVDRDGVITTVAGSGAPSPDGGFAGDGGPATEARLSRPNSVAVDRYGNLFIADSGNYRIRKVDTAGRITTIAGTGTPGFSGDGGPAMQAQLNIPSSLEVDPFGNLFFVDFANNRIRRIDYSGTVTTVASGQQFGGLALDGAGRPFASWYNMPSPLAPTTWRMQVGRIEPSGALTVMGGDEPGFAGDGGPAIGARFYYPYDVAFDAGGRLLVADGLNRRVRRITDAGAPASVGDDIVRFLVKAYLDILGRQPSSVEIAFWGPLLVQGMPWEWVGGVLVLGQEFHLLASVALYSTWLGRAPTAAEATALARRLKEGLTIEQAWAELAGSEESWARLGRDPGAYVDALYRLAFGRDPDPAGQALWVDKLRGGFPRTHAALAFVYNPAGSAHLVELTYSRFLGREGDQHKDFWVAQLQAGMRSEYLFAFFAGTPEYRARAAATVDLAALTPAP